MIRPRVFFLSVLLLAFSAQSANVLRFTIEQRTSAVKEDGRAVKATEADSGDTAGQGGDTAGQGGEDGALPTAEGRTSFRTVESAVQLSSSDLVFHKGHRSARPLMVLLLAFSPKLPWTDDAADGPLQTFSWDNCGRPSSVLNITEISVTPDPVPNPGTVTVTFAASLSQQVNAPLEADVVLEKKIAFVWVKVPCQSGRGSCSYSDVCSVVPKDTCPIKAGSQSMTQSFYVPSEPSGDYQVTVNLKSNGAWLACLHAIITLA